MNELQLKGIIAYPVTPFAADGSGIDEGVLARMLDRLIDGGCHAIAPLGSTGESAYLSDREWDRTAEFAVQRIRRRVAVVVGIADLATANAVRRARYAQQVGADAVMVLPISYWKLSEAEIYQHYSRIAQAVDLPI